MITAFPKIFALGSHFIIDIFKDEVEITEKVDGSQFAFGIRDDEVITRSKGIRIYPENVDKMFVKAVEYANRVSVSSIIPDGFSFYCEYLNKPKHNVIEYDRVPKNNLVLFGISDQTGKFLNYDAIKYWANKLEIDEVPFLFGGKVSDIDAIDKLLDTESYLGGSKIEGFVVKNYDRKFLLGGQPMSLMSGKYVSEAFKEKHGNDWKKGHTSKGKWEMFKAQYRSEARWRKAVQHLTDSGDLLNEPRDIGILIKEVKNDITEECQDEIKDFLWNGYGGELLRMATSGLPEWYKKRLLDRAMSGG